jgi:hypothetical protein
VSDQISRIQREWPDLEDCGQRSRRGSIATGQEWLKGVKDESTDSVDSSMGFRELERVSPQRREWLMAAYCKDQETEF